MKFVLLFALLAYTKFPLGNAAGAGQVSWEFHAAFSMLGWLEKRNSCIVHSKKCVGLFHQQKLFNFLRLVPIFIILWFQILQQIVYVQVKFVIWICHFHRGCTCQNRTSRVLSSRKRLCTNEALEAYNNIFLFQKFNGRSSKIVIFNPWHRGS